MFKTLSTTLIFVFLYSFSLYAQVENENLGAKPILLLRSYNTSFAPTAPVFRGFYQAMNVEQSPISFTTIDFNSRLISDPVLNQLQFESHLPDIQAGKYSALVAMYGTALNVLRDNIDKIPSDIPIIFCSESRVQTGIDDANGRITGVICEVNPYANVRFGMSLYPETSNVIFLTDAQKIGMYAREELAQLALMEYPNLTLNFIDCRYDSLDVLIAKLKKMEENSFIIYDVWDANSSSNQAMTNKLFDKITTKTGIPIIVMRSASMNDNVVGGVISNGEEAGRIMADMTIKAAFGAPISELNIQNIPCRPVLNYMLAIQNNFDMSLLPTGTKLVNQKESIISFMKKNPSLPVSLFILLLALTAGIIFFTRTRIYEKKIFRRNLALFNKIPGYVLVTDGNGKIYFWKPDLTDKDHNLLTISHMREVEDIDFDEFMAMVQKVIKNGMPLEWCHVFGEHFRSVRFSPFPRDIFGVDTVIMVSLDASELHKSREIIKLESERSHRILASIADGIIVTDKNGNIELVNSITEKLIGCEADEMTGQPIEAYFNIVNYLDNTPVESPIRKTLHCGRPIELANHTDLISKNHKRYHIADSAAPIFDTSGEISGAVMVFRDVTEEYDKRDTLRLSMLLLEQACSLIDMNFFRFDIATNEVKAIANTTIRFWPILNGKNIPLNVWFTGKNYDKIQDGIDKIMNGFSGMLSLEVESEYGGFRRIYSIYVNRMSCVLPDSKESEIFGIIQDITLLREKDVQRLTTLTLLETVMANIPIPIYIKDIDNEFRYCSCNAAAAEKFRIPADEILEKNDFDIFKNNPDCAAMIRQGGH